MIQVHYFARYKERLGKESETLSWDASFKTLNDLRQHLAERGGVWTEILGENNLMTARNQTLCSLAEPLSDGDEIAFFPPVTGG